jgi:divalent metal cation (Fe/Co/Zn/Cd) transporter
MASHAAARTLDLRRVLTIEAITIVWMVIEAAVAIGVGVTTRSGAALAFGVDSLIDWARPAFWCGACGPSRISGLNPRSRRLSGRPGGLSAATLLGGLALNALFGWWWADPIAALGIVYFLVREGREA